MDYENKKHLSKANKRGRSLTYNYYRRTNGITKINKKKKNETLKTTIFKS